MINPVGVDGKMNYRRCMRTGGLKIFVRPIIHGVMKGLTALYVGTATGRMFN